MTAAEHPTLAVTHARVFGIAAPTMVANLTTPLLGIVGTAVIGRLGQAHLLGAVAMSALVFDQKYLVVGAQPYPVLEQVLRQCQAEAAG